MTNWACRHLVACLRESSHLVIAIVLWDNWNDRTQFSLWNPQTFNCLDWSHPYPNPVCLTSPHFLVNLGNCYFLIRTVSLWTRCSDTIKPDGILGTKLTRHIVRLRFTCLCLLRLWRSTYNFWGHSLWLQLFLEHSLLTELVNPVSAQAPLSYCRTNWKRNQKFHSLSWDRYFELCLAIFEFWCVKWRSCNWSLLFANCPWWKWIA